VSKLRATGPRLRAIGTSAANLSEDGGRVGGSQRAANFDVPELERYRDDRLLGVGGMGRVMRVHDRRLGRDVALKEPRPDARNPDLLEARLAREAWIVARLEHPGIVPVYDVGTTVDGGVYYTMPVVRGRSLAEVLAETPALEDRLRLVRRVFEASEAVAAAHRQGVVHRDLKPANIMLGVEGGTRVLDWGLARVVDGEDEDDPVSGSSPAFTALTSVGAVIGTLQYMSPEQARGEPAEPRSDVWSLGAILFEVCAGRALRPPSSPSVALGRARAAEAPTLEAVGAGVPAELVAILTRAIASNPEARYPDARAFADDLACYLDGRPVAAHRYTRRELLGRLIRAWRRPLAVAGVGLAVIVGLVGFGIAQLAAEAHRAQEAELEAIAALDEAARNLASSLRSQTHLYAAAGTRPEAEVLAAHALALSESPEMRGILAAMGAGVTPTLEEELPLPACLSSGISPDGRAAACRDETTLSVWSLEPLRPRWTIPLRTREVVWAADHVAATTTDARLVWLDATSGELRASLDITPVTDGIASAGPMVFGRSTGWVWWAASPGAPRADRRPCIDRGSIVLGASLDPVTRRWAAACRDGALIVDSFDAPLDPTRYIATSLVGPRTALALAFYDDDHVVAGTDDGHVLLVDIDEGEVLSALWTGLNKVTDLAVLGASGQVVATGLAGAPVLLDPGRRLVHGSFPGRRGRATALEPGPQVALASGTLRRWRVDQGLPAVLNLGFGVTSVAFHPAGTHLAVTTGDRVEVRALATGDVVLEAEADRGFIKQGSFSRDGGRYLTGGTHEPYLRIWATGTWSEAPPRPTGSRNSHRRVATLTDGWVATLPYTGGVAIWAPGERDPWPPLAERPERFRDLAVSASGDVLAVVDEREHVILRVRIPSLRVDVVGQDERTQALAVAGDGDLIVTAGEGGGRVWDVARGAPTLELETGSVDLETVALSPDDRLVALGGRDGTVWIRELPSGSLLAKSSVHTERIASLAFSPDGELLASGSWDGTVRLHAVGRLRRDAPALVDELERTWGLSLQDVTAPADLE